MYDRSAGVGKQEIEEEWNQCLNQQNGVDLSCLRGGCQVSASPNRVSKSAAQMEVDGDTACADDDIASKEYRCLGATYKEPIVLEGRVTAEIAARLVFESVSGSNRN